jgi:FkbM family methyltransferase
MGKKFPDLKSSKDLTSEYLIYLQGETWWSENFFHALNSSLEIVLKEILTKGKTAIDVGANRGHFLQLMTELVGTSGTALGIEPNKSLVQYLESRGLDVLEVAVSPEDSSQKTIFRVPKTGIGSDEIGSISKNYLEDYFGYSKDSYDSYEVDTLVLDQILETFTKVDFLKVDAEGLDTKILLSSEQLSGKVDALVWEHNAKLDVSTAELLHQKLESFGFIIFDCFMNELSLSTCLDPWVSPINRYAFQKNSLTSEWLLSLMGQIQAFWSLRPHEIENKLQP